MSVFNRAGSIYLRDQRIKYLNGKLELVISNDGLVNWLKGQLPTGPDHELSNVTSEAITEIQQIILENVKGVDPRWIEALKSGIPGIWFSKTEKLKDVHRAPEEIEIAAEAIRLLKILGEEAEYADDTLRINCPNKKYKEHRALLMQILGAAFEVGRITERGIACLLLPDAKKGIKRKTSDKTRLDCLNAKRIEKSEPYRVKYLNLWQEMKQKNPNVSTVKINDTFRKWYWENKFPPKYRPVPKTLQRWRKESEL